MSELGSSSDMPFEIRAVHDVCYPGGDNENQLFGLLPGANCAQSSGVIRGQKPTQIEPYGVVPPYIKNQPSGHMGLDISPHYPPGAPLPPTSRPIDHMAHKGVFKVTVFIM